MSVFHAASGIVPATDKITTPRSDTIHRTAILRGTSILNRLPAVVRATGFRFLGSRIVVNVDGHGFVPTSKVTFNGEALPTIFLSSNSLEAMISYIKDYQAFAFVRVHNPAPGAAISNAKRIVWLKTASISISGPSSVAAGGLLGLSEASVGLQSPRVTWSVGGITGGNRVLGTISNAGVYQAPTTPPEPAVVIVSCRSDSQPEVSAQHSVEVDTSIPYIQSATAADQGYRSYVIDLIGTGFTQSSTITLSGTVYPVTYISASHLQTRFVPLLQKQSAVVAIVTNTSGSNPTIVTLTPPAGSLRDLAGCTNPNTGTPGDNGSPNDPAYIDVTWFTKFVGTPTYASNSIFWASRENGPGKAVIMTGAFTTATKRIRVAYIPNGTGLWESLVRASSYSVPAIQLGTTALSFVIPSDLPDGMYGFEIDDPTAPPITHLLNEPSVNWAVGVPSSPDPSGALQHEISDCSVEQGDTLRIFGKNFVASDQVVMQGSDGSIEELTPSKLDSNSLSVIVPMTLPPGSYTTWLGSSPWTATSSLPSTITVLAPISWDIVNVNCPAIAPVEPVYLYFQSCMDDNAPTEGSHRLAYITLPSGVFELSQGLKGRPYELLLAGAEGTALVGKPKGAPVSVWMSVPPHFGMVGVHIDAPPNPTILSSTDVTTGNPATTGHEYFSNIDIRSTGALSGDERMVILSGPDLQIHDSTFLSDSGSQFDLALADGAWITGTSYIVNHAGNSISNSQNVIFENNLAYSQTAPGPLSGVGFQIARSYGTFRPSLVSQNIYMGYNTFRDMGEPDQFILMNDGGGGAYLGYASSSTATTVTLADEPNWIYVGTTNPRANTVAIIAGTGVGQYSLLDSYSGKLLNVVTPWVVQPDATSVIVVSCYHLNMTYAHNTFTNISGMDMMIGSALESVMEDNTMTNAGRGMFVLATGPAGGDAGYSPVMNSEILRNIITVGRGDLILPSTFENVGGIGIFDGGTFLSGLNIRDNIVPHIQTIYNTNGLNGINGNLIGDNQANWLPDPLFSPSPQFLSVDNVPQ